MSLEKLKNIYFLGSLVKNLKGIYDKVNEIIDYLNGVSGDGSYKSYTALITQVGTDAPTVIELSNILGEDLSTERFGSGGYKLTALSPIFKENKVFAIISQKTDYDAFYTIDRLTDYSIIITSSVLSTISPADDLLINNSLEIRIYN